MRRFLISALAIVLVVGIAITVALLVTPTQTVSAAGQTVRVGVAAPSLSLSGPGELELFGQRLPTTIEFAGPVRPRLELAQITLSPQLAGLIQPDADSSAWDGLQQALVDGWVRYLAWQVAIVALIVVVLLSAIAGWRRLSKRSTLAFLAVGLVVADEHVQAELGARLAVRFGQCPALTESDCVAPALAAEEIFRATGLTTNLGPTLEQLADLNPTTLAIMHCSSYTGNGAAQLRALADGYAVMAGAG